MTNPFYYSAPWREFRAEVMRERPRCEVAGCGLPAKHLDHVVALARGGAPLSRANVRALCPSHHSAKTVREDRGFGRAPRPGRDVVKGCDAEGLPLDPGHRWRG